MAISAPARRRSLANSEISDREISGDDELSLLAEEFVARYREGQRPSLNDYARRYPRHAQEIRDLFPAFIAMENMAASEVTLAGADAKGSLRSPRPEQLGDYRIVREIGRGGMGVVYEAEHLSLGRRVALKLLSAGALSSAAQLQRFEREARTAARLHHTNIVPVFGVGHCDGLHYYAMQYISGLSLQGLLEEWKAPRLVSNETPPGGASKVDRTESMQDAASRRGPDPSGPGRRHWNLVAKIGLQTAEALAYAGSQGILHRDIKPSNLLMDDGGTLWITDFGLAKVIGDGALTETGDLLGTLRYMAPETLQGRFDQRSDLFSLGLTLYELLALRPAYGEIARLQLLRQVTESQIIPLGRVTPEIPRDLETIVMKAVARDPGARYPTARAMADDLQRFLADQPIKARPLGPSERLWRWSRRNPLVAGLAATIAVILSLAVVVLGISNVRINHEKELKDSALAQKQEALGRMKSALRLADERAKQIGGDMARLNAANGLLQRGRWKADAAQWAKAHADLNDAVELYPENSTVWYERAEFYARLGLFEQAEKDFAQGFELQKPDLTRQWFCRAILSVYVGDTNGYRDVCLLASKQFGSEAKDIQGDNEIVRACAMAPLPEADLAWAARVMQKAVAQQGERCWNLTAMGMVQYRAGKYEEAIAVLRKSLLAGDWLAGCQTNAVLAMALQRLGQTQAAREALTKAQQALDAWSQAWLAAPAGSIPIWWLDWMPCQLLYREAKTLIDGAPPEEDPRLWVVRGRAWAALEREDEAQACYRRAFKLAPDDLAIHLAALPREADLDERTQELAGLERFLEQHPNQPAECRRALAQRHYDLGELLRGEKHGDEALAAYGRAVELASDFKEAWSQKGLVSLDLYRFKDAAEDFSHVIELDPKDAGAWNGRGYSHCHSNELDEAVADHSKAIELDPNLAASWFHRSFVHIKLGQYDKAIADCSKAIELDPKYAVAWCRRGVAQDDSMQLDEAIADYTKAIELDPKYVLAWSNRGLAHFNLNEFDEAVADYTKAIELAPDSAVNHNNLAWLLATSPDPKFRDPRRAVELAKRAVELAPEDAGNWNTLGAAQYHTDDWKLAIEALTRSMELRNGGHGSDWLFLAMAHWKIGSRETARKWYDQTVAWVEKNNPRDEQLERLRVEAAELLEKNEPPSAKD
ncbi:MAG TPA: tetratricopeptide repeat protein [Pirellulales bacterium]|nr:tetratricopeptide repeat protein [Pirellulales bacterium]